MKCWGYQHDWLTFGTVDDIWRWRFGLACESEDKGNGQKFCFEKSGFDDDGIYEFLIDDGT